PLNIGGERELVAFVAPGTAHDALTTSESLYTCCSRHLPPNLIPARFIIRDKLPQTPTGKIDRRSLLLELESQTDRKTATSTPEPHEDLLSQVKDLWAQALNLHQIEDDTDFFLAGGNSLSAMELLIKVGNLVGQTITFADFVHCPTPRQLSDFLQRYPAKPRPNLVILREDGEGIPLFCIPPWNGSRTYFQRLVQQLVPGFPVYGLEPEMDDSDQVRATNLAELVACHHATLESAWPEGEVRLIGYSN
ncbi:MAG: hypothetical protein KJT03_24755, partial [Verrucomicrobiae bacterium]|nr:hypothetical protein [Verrucomicrobiae bacterium]